ncbi:MAG TPA: hypothetical protein ENH82_00350 [bacterium]|nr:hypothetical protein [bacterium]
MKSRFRIFLEKIMNKFGWYKLPRYFIYKVHEDGHESKYGSPCSGGKIYNHFEMLHFTGMLEIINKQQRPKMKYRVERINL